MGKDTVERNSEMRINLRIRSKSIATFLNGIKERERSFLIEHAIHIFLKHHGDDHLLEMLTRGNSGTNSGADESIQSPEEDRVTILSPAVGPRMSHEDEFSDLVG